MPFRRRARRAGNRRLNQSPGAGSTPATRSKKHHIWWLTVVSCNYMRCHTGAMDTTDPKLLWQEYADNPSPELREQLILKYVPLVRYVASRVGAGTPSYVEHQDLVQYGIFGLINAIDRFDLAHGVKFETYAVTRIRGAIIDELRSLDWVPRSVRSQTRALDKAREELRRALARDPSDEELAEHMGVQVEAVWTARGEAFISSSMTSFDAPITADSDQENFQHGSTAVADHTADDPVLSVELDRTTVLLASVIAGLPDKERIVAALYYREGIKLADIGKMLGVTQTRVCSVYTSAAQMVRHRLALVG